MQFSVIIPTRDRPSALANCLQSFGRLDFPEGQWELIVVNDGGERSLNHISANLKQSLPLRLVTISHAGPATARNEGARLAQGEFLAFTDDDCQVSPDWLQAFSQGFTRPGFGALGGCSLTPSNDRAAERAWQHLVKFLYSFMRDANGDPLLLISNNAAYRKEVFQALGGFNESFPLAAAEDLELSFRLRNDGFRQAYCPDAVVWHHHKLSTWGHIAQQFRYGRGGYLFHSVSKNPQNSNLTVEYSHPDFYKTLLSSLRDARLPLSSSTILIAGQIAYQLGLRYQRYLAA